MSQNFYSELEEAHYSTNGAPIKMCRHMQTAALDTAVRNPRFQFGYAFDCI